jgi:hypothetical protein
VEVAVMATTTLLPGLDTALADEVEAWLHDPSRTAHRLVSLPTVELMRLALADEAPAAAAEVPVLPRGLWSVLPDRLLALHPGRRVERMDRLRIPVRQHLELTAQVLSEWGWAQTGRRVRTVGGGRCILGAQYALFRLGYGTEVTVEEAGRRIQGVLGSRGVHDPYPRWNERPNITGDMAVAVVRAAAGVT